MNSYITKDGKHQIEWTLEERQPGQLVFSASSQNGQNIDEIAEKYPDDPMVQRIARVWRSWHLNDMRAGTPKQESFLKSRGIQDYDKAVEALRKAGLYTDHLPAVPTANGDLVRPSYKYGSQWLYEPIPDDVLAEIRSWEGNTSCSFYDSQADQFLRKHGLKIRITLADSKPAPWDVAGHHYRVTITGKRPGRLTFDFWGSAKDAEERKDPSRYSVLACIASDSYCPDTLAEFCSEYGFNPDSIKDRQTFARSSRFAKRLLDFFSVEELEALREIQ